MYPPVFFSSLQSNPKKDLAQCRQPLNKKYKQSPKRFLFWLWRATKNWKLKNVDTHCIQFHERQQCETRLVVSMFEYSKSAILLTWGNSWSAAPQLFSRMKLCEPPSLYLSDEGEFEGLQMCSWISDYHQAVSDCKSIPNVGHWPCTVMDSMATHCNTKPSHTHSPMAGALLQISTICCSSKAKSDGQVIQKTQQWQWGHCLWIIWPLVYTI